MMSTSDTEEEDDSYPSGWLWKVGSQVPTWRRRYFRLEPGCLVYYKEKPTDAQLNTTDQFSFNGHGNNVKPVGTVIIDGSCRIEKISSYSTRLKSTKKDCIRLLGGHGRCLILAPDVTPVSLFNGKKEEEESKDIKCWYDALTVEIGRLEIEALMLIEQAKQVAKKDLFQFNSIPFPKSHFDFNTEGQSVMITGVALNARPSRCFSAPVHGSRKSNEDQTDTKEKAATMAHAGEMVVEIDSTLRAVLRNIPNIKEYESGYIPKFEDLHYFFSPPESCIPVPSSSLSLSGSYGNLSVSERYSQFIINTSSSVLSSLSSLDQPRGLLTKANSMASIRSRPVSVASQLSSSSLFEGMNAMPSPFTTVPEGTGGGTSIGSPPKSSSSPIVLSKHQRRSSTLMSLANNQWKGFRHDWEEERPIDESESDGE